MRASSKVIAHFEIIAERRTIESRKPPPESCASRSETCGDKKFWRPRPRKKLRSLTPRSKLLNIPQTAMNSRAPSVTAASTRRSMTRAPRTQEHPSPSLQHRSRLQLLLVSPSFFFACETMGRSATHTDRLSCSQTFSLPCLARCSLCRCSCRTGSRFGCVGERFSRLGRFLDRWLCVRQRARACRSGAADSVVWSSQDSSSRGGGRLLVSSEAHLAGRHHLPTFCRRTHGVRHSVALHGRMSRDDPGRVQRDRTATGTRSRAFCLQAAQDVGDAQFGRTATVPGLRQGVQRLPQVL